MNPWTRIESPWVALLDDDIDTDQIIPARFLVTTTREGLGASLFAPERQLLFLQKGHLDFDDA